MNIPSDSSLQSPITYRPSLDQSLYLSFLQKSDHPFCSNAEGWRPISRDRYDLSPCVLDIGVAAVAVYGVLFGFGALWYLLKKCKPQDVPKNWHFYAKLVVIALLIVQELAQAAIQIAQWPGVWFVDFRFYATVATALSFAVLFGVQYVEHWRSRIPNGVVLIYWLLFVIVSAIKLRSLVSQRLHLSHLPYFILFAVGAALGILELVLEWLIPKKTSAYESLFDPDECPYEYADVFSVLAFSWMTPMMRFGYKHFITQEDLPNLRPRDYTSETTPVFEKAWQAEKESRFSSLWFALFRAFSGPFFRGAIFKTASDVLNFVQPQLLKFLITFVESYSTPEPQPVIRGIAVALAMFATSVCQTACLHQYFQRTFETGMRVKSSLTASIYSKSMRLSNEGRASKSSGDIVNLMAVDTMRLQDLTQYGQMLWSAPFQIILCMASLYQLTGLSMLAGVLVMALMIPINSLIANLMKSFQKRQMKTKDARTRLMTEILNNMKSIKLYAWTTAFMKRLNHIRNDEELKTLRKIGATQAFANFTWSTTPFLVSCSTFAVFVFMQDRPLTTDIVFPALTLFNLLTFPLSVLPMVITAIIEAQVAVSRLTEFFNAEEVQPDAVLMEPPAQKHGDEAVSLQKVTVTWDRFGSRNTLEDITFAAKKGELTCILGRVGSGKSSLLEAILGDLFKRQGDIVVHGKTAYVAQSAWIMNASVKENIVFGHKWDPSFYDRTVKACALLEDFESLPDRDETEVGERGISLSGGQKARLTLARAVYARADVYLLDDVLSAVDQHVGRHLINEVLGPRGLLATKARILATNSIPVLLDSDYIVHIKAGRVVEEGSYNELVGVQDSEVAELIRSAQSEGPNEKQDEQQGNGHLQEKDYEEEVLLEEVDEEEETLAELVPFRPVHSNLRKRSTMTLRRASTASFDRPRGKIIEEGDDDDEEAGVKSRQSKETSEKGKVKWTVYGEYAKTSNLVAVAMYLIALITAQTLGVGSSVWLKQWAEENADTGTNADVPYFIGIYFALGMGSAALVVLQTLILWIFCSVEASRKLHERMAISMFRAPMSFFETTPAGRILNRFSADIYKVDELLARTFNMLFVSSARAILTLVIISVSTPAFVILIVPLTGVYLYIQRYYLRTSRELKRLDSVSRSPIYAHFQESLSGVSTIKAYRQQHRFALENEWRVDANLRAYFPSISANRWIAIRLEFLGSIIILAAAIFAITSVASHSGLSAGLVGLAMSYALQITQSLNWIVRQTVEVETNIVSVERVLEYSRLPSEAPEIVPQNRPPISWPAHGALAFHNFSTRYRPGLDLVLKSIEMSIKSREKIGVVGRTGAGKSSLTLALFRIIEPSEGFVSIDDLNTSTIGLMDLRQRLAIIPQDAAMFEGTVRDNLDPGHVHEDSELWDVLDHARLKEHVSSMDGKLEAWINEGGSNLSQGQRQLVSIARALLTPSNILVLDEATAAVDVQTDALLQERMKTIFKDRTIITIAHRINTILDSDRILVLEKGEIAEFDTPSKLIESKGLFYELAREAGLIGAVSQQQQ